MNRKIAVLTEGHTNPHTAKTASSMVRYRPDQVLGLLDRTIAGKSTQEVLGVGGTTPIVESLDELPGANTLLIGIAPPGGKIPSSWRPVILDAISRKMDVVSGLHDFLSDDDEFRAAAEQYGVMLTDVRKNNQNTIARRVGLDESCLRVLTVGHDCSVGKMVTAIEINEGLQGNGVDSKFVATGQTGIMVEGDGCPLDCVVADFVSGAAEQLVLDNQHHEVLLFEGQGSLVHPSYSGVTLSLLHGSAPHAMVMCYEIGRDKVTGIDMTIPSLDSIIQMYEMIASPIQPSKVIGISMNSRRISEAEADEERKRVSDRFEMPVVDIFRHGPDELIDAVENFRSERNA